METRIRIAAATLGSLCLLGVVTGCSEAAQNPAPAGVASAPPPDVPDDEAAHIVERLAAQGAHVSNPHQGECVARGCVQTEVTDEMSVSVFVSSGQAEQYLGSIPPGSFGIQNVVATFSDAIDKATRDDLITKMSVLLR